MKDIIIGIVAIAIIWSVVIGAITILISPTAGAIAVVIYIATMTVSGVVSWGRLKKMLRS